MKDQILEAFKNAEISLPEGLDLKGLDKKAEKIYNNTRIETPKTMSRDLARNAGHKAADVALLKIAQKLGIKDADLLSARIKERTHLLAELRGHDSLVRMILKIGASAGLKFDPDNMPTSTIEALKVGIILQMIYASLADKANNSAGRERELLSAIEKQNAQLEKMQGRIDEIQGKASSIERVADLRAEVISGTEKSSFHICGEAEHKIKWITWRGPAKPPVYKVGDDHPTFSSIKMVASVNQAGIFKSLEDARDFMDWLQSRTLLKRVADPSSLRIARFVAEDFGQ